VTTAVADSPTRSMEHEQARGHVPRLGRGRWRDVWPRAWGHDGLALYGALGLTLCGLVLRLCFLFQPMRYDEATTYLAFASKGLATILVSYTAPNNHVLHTILVHYACALLGPYPWVIRLPALVAGTLLIPATYLVARLFYDARVALLSAALVASSSALVLYSTNARGYTMVSLIFLALLALAWRLREHRSRRGWQAFVLLSAAGFFTVPVMLYPFGVVVLWLILSAALGDVRVPKAHLLKDLLKAVVGVAALTATLYAPIVAFDGLKALVANDYVQARGWPAFLAALAGLWAFVGAQWDQEYPAAIRLVLLVGLATGVGLHRRVGATRAPLPLAVVGWCVPLLLLSGRVAFPRVYLFLLPVGAMVAAAGLVALADLALHGAQRFAPLHASTGRGQRGLRRYPANQPSTSADLPARPGGQRAGDAPLNGAATTRARRSGRGLRVVVALALAVAVVKGVDDVQRQTAYSSNDTGTLRDAAAITADLKPSLRLGDAVVNQLPSDAPLAYYFLRSGIPLSYVYAVPRHAPRLFAVVSLAEGQTLRGVLRAERIATRAYTLPRLLRRYRYADVYDMRRVIR